MSYKLEAAQVVQQEQQSLRDALGGLSKDELTVIRKNIAVKNVSKLNRDQLFEALVEQLPQCMAEELPSLLQYMDEERIECLEQATKKNGTIVIDDTWTELMVKYWQELALLFKDERGQRAVMYMPTELISVVKEALKHLDRKQNALNTAYLQVVKGMVYYYGVLTYSQLEELTSRYPMFEQLPVNPVHLIISYRHYHADFALNETYIHHVAIPDPTLIVAEQNKRDNLVFASLTILQLQEAGQSGYVLRTEGHRLLVEYLVKQFKLPNFEANLVADQCEFAIRAGLQLEDLIQYVGTKLQIDDASIQLLLPRLIIMYNHTPQWCLKGYYSTQLSNDQETKGQSLQAEPATLGRNDICYCGSGKKYKKCCMNK